MMTVFYPGSAKDGKPSPLFFSAVRIISVLLLVGGTTFAQSARHTAATPTYRPGQTITIAVTIDFSGTAQALGYSVDLPLGWSFVGATVGAGDIGPVSGTITQLEWAWKEPQVSPVVFSYTVAVSRAAGSAAQIKAKALVRQNRALRTIPSAPLNLRAVAQE
jgi:hypothetical protein